MPNEATSSTKEDAGISLARFRNPEFDRARPLWIEALWMVTQALFVSSWLPGSAHRCVLLKVFGARIGTGVVVKPRVRIKFPWRLEIGDHSWIGEDVWIDNLAVVKIGSNTCISQGAYLCTGSHDWSSPSFDLIVKPITVGDNAWVAAKSTVGPGVTVGEGAVLGLGSTTSNDLAPWGIHAGSPAVFIKRRTLKRSEQD